MIIIRVECATNSMRGDYGGNRHINNGCYSGNGIAYEAIDQQAVHEGRSDVSSNDMRHPTPSEDNIHNYCGSHVCAFKDWNQFKNWFCLWQGLEAIANRARLALYHVPDEHVQIGSCQVVADSDYMHLVKVLRTNATLEQVTDVYRSHSTGRHLCLTRAPSCREAALLPSCSFISS